MEKEQVIEQAAAILKAGNVQALIDNGRTFTVAEIEHLLTNTPVQGRKIAFYELEPVVQSVAQTENKGASGKTLVGGILQLDRVMQSRKKQ